MFMTKPIVWKEFEDSGFLWWINMLLHTFGWCINVNKDENGNIIDVYPARTMDRGFAEFYNREGYQKVADDLYKNIDDIRYDAYH